MLSLSDTPAGFSIELYHYISAKIILVSLILYSKLYHKKPPWEHVQIYTGGKPLEMIQLCNQATHENSSHLLVPDFKHYLGFQYIMIRWSARIQYIFWTAIPDSIQGMLSGIAV